MVAFGCISLQIGNATDHTPMWPIALTPFCAATALRKRQVSSGLVRRGRTSCTAG
jgi:hypothetical protein